MLYLFQTILYVFEFVPYGIFPILDYNILTKIEQCKMRRMMKYAETGNEKS